MSTFDGILKEYPFISIDQFLKENFSSTIFFLSHCHTDHMRGLGSPQFYDILKERSYTKIYMSKVSKILLQNDNAYEHISDYLENIPIECPTTVIIPDDKGNEVARVIVTLLPAGHCPGSVMFLFEGANGNVLYTGDFRLEIGNTKRFKHLHNSDGRVKPISCLYLDTTFCDSKSLFIPSREQCLQAISSLVQEWVTEGPNHIIHFILPANYGYEYVFISLYERFGYKTHVTAEKYRKYREIEEIREVVTVNPCDAKIHPCRDGGSGRAPCGYETSNNEPVYVRRIKLSAMFYTTDVTVNDIVIEKKDMFQACYSTHSSLTEMWDMVTYLRPRSLHANVIPDNKTEEEVLKWLIPLLNNDHSTENEFKMPALGVLLRTAAKDSVSSSYNSFDFEYNPQVNITDFQSSLDTTEGGDNKELLRRKSEDPGENSESESIVCTSDSQKTTETSSSEIDINLAVECSDPLQFPSSVNASLKKDYPVLSSTVPVWHYSPDLQEELANSNRDPAKVEVDSVLPSDLPVWHYSPNSEKEQCDHCHDSLPVKEEDDFVLSNSTSAWHYSPYSQKEIDGNSHDSSPMKMQNPEEPAAVISATSDTKTVCDISSEEENTDRNIDAVHEVSSLSGITRTAQNPIFASDFSSNNKSVSCSAVHINTLMLSTSQDKFYRTSETYPNQDTCVIDNGLSFAASDSDETPELDLQMGSNIHPVQNIMNEPPSDSSVHKSSAENNRSSSPSLIQSASSNLQYICNVSHYSNKKSMNNSFKCTSEVSFAQNNTTSFSELHNDNSDNDEFASQSIIKFDWESSVFKKKDATRKGNFDSNYTAFKKRPCVRINTNVGDELIQDFITPCKSEIHSYSKGSVDNKNTKVLSKTLLGENESLIESESFMKFSLTKNKDKSVPVITLSDDDDELL